MSPQSPGVGNQSHDAAAYMVNPMEMMITALAILSKALVCIFFPSELVSKKQDNAMNAIVTT